MQISLNMFFITSPCLPVNSKVNFDSDTHLYASIIVKPPTPVDVAYKVCNSLPIL